MPAATTTDSKPTRHRPKSYTVFAAAFLAGAAAAVGVNRVLDVQMAQRRPQVECEPIFVALRPLAQGSPVTVWDVALKDWPKAMLPTSALRAGDAFEGYVLRHAIREGQPLLAVQLVRSGSGEDQAATEAFVPAVPAPVSSTAAADLWTPAETAPAEPMPAAALPAAVTATPTPNPAVASVESVDPEPAQDDVTASAVPTAQPPSAEPSVVASSSTGSDAADIAEAAEPAAPTVAPVPPESPTPTAAAPTLASEPIASAPADGVEDDTSEAVATDVASMPSVMAAPTPGGPAATRATRNDAGRFLVVPERIALQADTSFTTPRPQPPGPPASARPAAQARPSNPTRPTSQPSRQAGPQTRSAQSSGQPSRPQQPPQSQRGTPSSPASKGWGGVFPNVAAGIDALGGQWQRMRSTAGQPQRGDQSISR